MTQPKDWLMRKPRDWGQPCPNPDCSLYKRMHKGNVSAISTYMTQSGKRRILYCAQCERSFSETRDTVFFDLRTPEEKVMMALKMLLAATKARVAGIPAFFSDGFTCYLAALIAAFHVVTTFARTGKRGRPRKPRCEPHPALVYGQLVKQKKQGKLLTLSTRVVLGAERLTQLGLTISTALVERVNLTLRQALAPLARKTSSFCKDRERMRQRVVLFQAFYNVARPHMSLRQPLPLHERTHHGAIRPRWRERTPALAAGVTDHVWTFRELLTAKFEPLDSQSISG